MNDDATIEIGGWLLAFGLMLMVIVCRVLGVW
jgi:hypothetical protein